MIKAIIFDCFGVIITDALSELLAELETTDPEKAERVIGLLNSASKGAMDLRASRIAVAAELGLTLDVYVEALRDGEVRNEPLLKYVKELRADYKTGLLSNVISGGLEARFPNDELSEYFDAVVASGDVGFIKPEPQAYEIIADRLKVRLDECIMIDDREDYCLGAKGVGMQVIQYKSFEQMKRELAELTKLDN